jgi:hypothetical protein
MLAKRALISDLPIQYFRAIIVNRNVFVAVILLAGCVACASAPANGGTNLQLITQQEIEKTNAHNAYEVVRKLRPNYQVGRRNITINTPQDRTTPDVYLNGQLQGPTEMLASVPVSSIAEIRLYHAGEVSPQWEQNSPSGLIAIKTR